MSAAFKPRSSIPTAALAFGLIQDPAWAVDIARAYNSWLHATYTKKNSRILGAAIDPDPRCAGGG